MIMIPNIKERIDLRYSILVLYILFTFVDNHSALFISDYYIPLLLFVFLSFITKPVKSIFSVNYKSVSFLTLLILITLGTLMNFEDSDKGTYLSYLVWFVFLFIAMNDSPNIRTIRMIMKSFIFGSTIMSIMVIVLRQNYYSSITLGLRYTIKFMGNVAIDPNYLASYLFVGFSASLFFALFYKGTKTRRMCYYIPTIIILFAIIMIGSRAGYCAVLITLIGALMQLNKYGRGNRKLLVAITLPIIVALFIVVLPMILPEDILRRMSFKSLNDTSNSLRISHWIASFECVIKKPLFGYGSMHTLNILEVYASHLGGAHNTFLTFLLHLGIIGAFNIIGIITSVFSGLRRKKNLYWCFFLIAFVFINCIIENHLGITFWLPLLLLVFIEKNENVYRISNEYYEVV